MKRRLQLMPEVLPAPNKVALDRPATSAVRERTMARLRVLAAVGAGIAAACGGGTTGSGSTSGDGSSGNGGRDGGLPDGMKPETDAGYGVVDPLPPPACFDYKTEPTAEAKFVDAAAVGVDPKTDPDGGATGNATYVEVTVTLNQKDVAVGDIDLGELGDIYKIVKKDLKAGVVVLGIRHFNAADDKSPFSLAIDIQTSCAKGPTRVTVRVTEKGPSDPGKLDVQVSYYGTG